MRPVTLTIPELFFLVGTRAMIAAGVALLAFRNLDAKKPRVLATTFITIGAVSTVPIAIKVFGKRNDASASAPEQTAFA